MGPLGSQSAAGARAEPEIPPRFGAERRERIDHPSHCSKRQIALAHEQLAQARRPELPWRIVVRSGEEAFPDVVGVTKPWLTTR